MRVIQKIQGSDYMSRIREVRRQAKLTQKQLAEHYDIPLRTLQDWETGKRKPPEYIVNLLLRCIAADFSVTLEEKTQSNTDKKFSLTYIDGTPLNTEDEMYVMAEREAKKLVLVNKDNGVETYRCSNGFTFKVKVMKRK